MDEDRARERALDEALEETFPASDAPANTVETGTRVGVEPPAVIDRRDAQRFEYTIGDDVAFLAYERRPGRLVLIHTEVPAAFRGRQVGVALIQHALDVARDEGRRIVPICPFVKKYLQTHPQSA